MAYMAVVEQRIGEIVQLYSATQKHGIISHFEVRARAASLPKQRANISSLQMSFR